jgi:opacity protein-like surface antigen
MKLRNALIVAGVLGLPTAALAQPVDGLYVGLGAGYNYMMVQKISNNGGGKLKTNGGPVALANVGWGFGNGFRLEIEGNWRNADQNQGSGHAQNNTYGGMLNALYDFDLGFPVYPYLGLGGGVVQQYMGKGRTANGTTFGGGETDGAIQVIAGVAYPLPFVDGLSLTAEYRFLSTFNDLNYGHASTNIQPQMDHSVLLGLRYALYVPAPPPPPAPAPVATPAPAPARTYLVFFDWDKYDLTARARQIIGEAAANVTKVQVTRIEVNGYTDTSGTPAYNLKLSVPANEIVTQGFGETHLLVPTGPGVREPQNRRVEIILK